MEFNVYCFVYIISLSLAAPYHHEEDYYDDNYKESNQRKPAKVIIQQDTERPVPTYEVTENVDDIPSPNPVAKPIVANYTTRKPLNIVPAANGNKSDSDQDVTSANNLTPNVKNDPISNPSDFDFDKDIPDVEEVDFDDEPDESHEEFHEMNVLPNIRAYLYGLQKGIVNGLHTLLRKGVYNISNNVNEPNFNSNPVLFMAKLRKKVNVAKNSKYFGHEFNDC